MKDRDIGFPRCIPWLLEWTHACTWKIINVTFSSRYAIQRPWICHTSTPCIDIKRVWFFREEKRVKCAEFANIHGWLEMVCTTLHGCCSSLTLCEHNNFTRKCFSFIQSRVSHILWCQKTYNSEQRQIDISPTVCCLFDVRFINSWYQKTRLIFWAVVAINSFVDR